MAMHLSLFYTFWGFLVVGGGGGHPGPPLSPTSPGWHIQTDFFRLTCPCWLVPFVPSRLTCPGRPIRLTRPGNRLKCPAWPLQTDLSRLKCPPTLTRLTCSGWPAPTDLSHLSLSCWPVHAVLSRLYCPGGPNSYVWKMQLNWLQISLCIVIKRIYFS